MKNERKFIGILLTMVMVMSIFSLFTIHTAAEGALDIGTESSEYPGFYYQWVDGEIYISWYNGSGGNITIPSFINGHPVAGIGIDAIRYKEKITGVILPDTVKEIQACAFEGCANLKSIAISDSVTEIHDGAFSKCTGLSDVTLGNSLQMIGPAAFQFCTDLTYIEIPDSVTRIDHAAFAGSGLTEVKIGKSIQEISNYAFAGCGNLHTIYGYSGTEAELYAVNHNITFIALDEKLKMGDVDGDGEITVMDVTVIQRFVSSMSAKLNEETLQLADIDGNGSIEIIDATYIQRFIANMEIPYAIG